MNIRKSTAGYYIKLNRQATVALSLTEAKQQGFEAAVRNAVWLTEFMQNQVIRMNLEELPL